MKNVIITILAILVLCLGGYLVYDKVLDKDVKEEVKEESSKQEEDKEIVIKNFINKTFDKNTIDKDILSKYESCGYGVDKLVLPMLESEKTGAIAFNELIQKDYEKDISMMESDYFLKYLEENKDNQKIVSIAIANSGDTSYVYTKTSDYISILITSVNNGGCATGGTSKASYTYDIKNDKYITNEELLNSFNITKEQVKNAFLTKTTTLTDYIEQSDMTMEQFENDLNQNFNNIFSVYINNNSLEFSYNNMWVDSVNIDI